MNFFALFVTSMFFLLLDPTDSVFLSIPVQISWSAFIRIAVPSGVEFLSHRVCMCSSWWSCWTSLSPPITNLRSSCSISPPALGIFTPRTPPYPTHIMCSCSGDCAVIHHVKFYFSSHTFIDILAILVWWTAVSRLLAIYFCIFNLFLIYLKTFCITFNMIWISVLCQPYVFQIFSFTLHCFLFVCFKFP